MKKEPPRGKKGAATAPKKVLIVDDHPFLRMGLARALGQEPGLSVCGEAGSAEEALELVKKLRPDVVITDLSLPKMSGLDLVKELASSQPDLPVIVLSMHEEEIYAERCLRAGSRGYVMKSEGPAKLAHAIRHVLDGGTYTSEKVLARILKSMSGRREIEMQTPVGLLSDREFEIFQLFGKGLSTQKVAQRLQVSPKTVETHRMHIKKKLGIKSAPELVAHAAHWTKSAA